MPDTTPSEPNPSDFGETARKSTDAGIADETASPAEAADLIEADSILDPVPTQGGTAEDESGAQPS